MSDQKTKNKMIGDRGSLTRQKRKNQNCHTYQLKIVNSHLTSSQKEYLKKSFIESKWCYNYYLNQLNNGTDINDINYKETIISHFDKDKNEIKSNITLGSSLRQTLISKMKQSLLSLSRLKKKGYKIGSLRFKSEINSITYRQYGITHKIMGSRIKLQGCKQPILLRGTKQLKGDITTCQLIKVGTDYYIKITCFEDKKEIEPIHKEPIGIDMGIKDHITCSNGIKYNILIEEPERLKKLQKKLSRQNKHSSNWYKTKDVIKIVYNRLDNKKNDAANKIVHELRTYKNIYYQDEALNEWKIKYGNTIQHSILGRIKSKLNRLKQAHKISKWEPTTQMCPNCGSLHKLSLTQRTYKCPNCGHEEDRDIHAAKNMILIGSKMYNRAGTARIDACGDE